MTRFFTAWTYLLALTLAPAFADSSLMLVGSGSQGGIPPASITYITSVSTGTTSTAHTFSGVSLGTPSADRYIVVGTCGSSASNYTLSAASIGGIGATIHYTGSMAGFFGALVPSGSTGNIVFTTSGSTGIGIVVYVLNALQSTTPISTNAAIGTSSPQTINLTSSLDGVAIGYGCMRVASLSMSLSNVTTDLSTTLISANVYNAVGSSPTSGTSFSSANTFSPANNAGGYYGIAFR